MMTRDLLLRLFGVKDPECEAAKSILTDYDNTVSRLMLLAIQEWMENNSTADTEGIKELILSLKDDAEVDIADLSNKLKDCGELVTIYGKKVEQYHDAIFSAQLLQLQDFELDELDAYLKEMESDSTFDKEELRSKISEKLGGDVKVPADSKPTQYFDFSVIPGEENPQEAPKVDAPTPAQAEEVAQAQPQVQENMASQDMNTAAADQQQSAQQTSNDVQPQDNSSNLMNLGGKLNQGNDQ